MRLTQADEAPRRLFTPDGSPPSFAGSLHSYEPFPSGLIDRGVKIMLRKADIECPI